MAQPNFDYEGALNAGYSQDEIKEFIQKSKSATRSPEENLIANNQSIKSPSTKEVGESFKKIANFDYEGALASGYNKDEINQFLESQKPKRSALEQAGKIAGQLGMGAVESALLPYEIAVAPLSIPGGQEALGDLFTREILSEVYPTEEEGKFVGQRELKEPIDLGVRSLTEKATGLDLKPEGVLEKAANWMGFIKNPKNWTNLAKSGITPKNLAKAIAPTGTEAMRGVGAGVALEMAEDGQYGPIGTMGAAIVGDMAGGGIGAIFKAGKRILTNPKESLAKFAAKMTKPEVKAGEILSKPEKLQLQKDVIKDFRDAGIQADLGTITNNNFIKMTQARLSQSGLSGNALREFKDTITKDIKQEYKALADSLGEARVISNHEAGLIAKEGMKSIREADLAATRQLYENANKSLRENSFVESKKLAESIAKLEKELKPGSIKSAEQSAVLNTLDKVKKDLYTPQGKLKLANVKDLMNNKIALNDIINYEVQGGAKQLLKGIVGELDRAIISHGKENIPFVRNYITANKRFAQHAKMFRSKNAKNIINAEDP
jgi:hypothetical protein